MYGDQSVLVYDFLSAFALVPGQVLHRFTGLPYKGRSMHTFNYKASSLEGRLFGGFTAGSSASVRFVVTVTSIVVVGLRLRVLLRFTCAGTLFRFGLRWLFFCGLILNVICGSGSRLRVGLSRVNLSRGVLVWGRESLRCGHSLVECVIVIVGSSFK